jgi:cytochrome c-type biogenesis protein
LLELFAISASGLWLGILTSISPCPLATNIAAISFIGKRVESPRLVLLGGLLYTLGRALTYSLLGVLLISSLLSAPSLSHALQEHMNKILGPILILTGMFLLELIGSGFAGFGMSEQIRDRAEKSGVWGGALLGVVFALSFCPVSAALFFGSLIPLAIKSGSSFLLPCLYGIGTALPVVAFAIIIALGAHSVGKAFGRIKQLEVWARRVTGVVFIGTGIYFSLTYIFRVFS